MREASTYRAARRNRVLRGKVRSVWHGTKPTKSRLGPIRANRSSRWAPFKDRLYAHGSR